jgi:hypothetical protein
MIAHLDRQRGSILNHRHYRLTKLVNLQGLIQVCTKKSSAKLNHDADSVVEYRNDIQLVSTRQLGLADASPF